MNVNHDISKKVIEKLEAIEEYKQFDIQREILIADALKNYQTNKYIDLTKINILTKKMNQSAIKQQLPQRKIVTTEMFLEYINKQH